VSPASPKSRQRAPRKVSKRGGSKQPAGAPVWMTTFGDMMTLLMAFFVLLLSLAEIDAVKYRAVAGELKRALGVKVDSVEVELADGTSDNPDIVQADHCEPCPPCAKSPDIDGEMSEEEEALDRTYQMLQEQLKDLAHAEKLYIARHEGRILLRIQEQGVFPSGSATIQAPFLFVLERVRDVLAEVEGGIRVVGHTDDVPISNPRFRSNWELSAARAVSVVHELKQNKDIDETRFTAVGYGESRPLVPNEDNASRAKNRRVEIMLSPSLD